jgi:hypothetical protein
MCFCGAAALATGVFAACSGPTPISGSTSVVGGGGSGQNGTRSGVDLTKTTSTQTDTSAGTGTGTEICDVATANLTKKPADVLLIVDRSGSMTKAIDGTGECDPTAGTCQQRWATMLAGLTAVLTGASGDVTWGLKTYSSDDACGVTPTMDVDISAAAAANIQTTLAGLKPGGNTPTQAAVKAGTAYLQSLTDTNGKYILLATDGEPNCLVTTGKGGRGGGGNGASDVDGTVAAITAAAAPGVGFKTYVIGVGPETGNLDNFAIAGGTTHYYPALSPQDLTAALSAIVGAVASCTFSLQVAPKNPNDVAIEFNGDSSLRAPHDTSHADGWDYTDSSNTTIQLYGSWCGRVTDGTFTSYVIKMGCPGQPIP